MRRKKHLVAKPRMYRPRKIYQSRHEDISSGFYLCMIVMMAAAIVLRYAIKNQWF